MSGHIFTSKFNLFSFQSENRIQKVCGWQLKERNTIRLNSRKSASAIIELSSVLLKSLNDWKKKLFKSIMKHLEGLISKVVLNGSLERKKNRERVLSRISSKGKQIPHHFVKASLRYRY